VTSASELRALVASEISALGAPWSESAWAYDVFPQAEGSGVAHGAFAVGIPTSASPNAIEGSARKRGAVGGLANSRVMVRFLWGIRSESQVADADAGLDAEDAVRAAALATSFDGHISIVRSDRALVGDGTWLLVTMEFAASHRIALE
jgi:hypothetical protein